MASHFSNDIAFCAEKVAPEGTCLYYATLFCPPPEKAFWLACFTLAHEVQRAALQQLDAGLTQVKLGWWRNALAEARHGKPQHPVIRAFGQSVVQGVPEEGWGMLIERHVQATEVKRYNTVAEWEADLLGQIEVWKPVFEARFGPLHWQGLAAMWVQSTRLTQILRLAKHLEHGFQPVPVELLEEYGVTAQSLRQREHSAQAVRLLEAQIRDACSKADLAWKTLPTPGRLLARPARALFRMKAEEARLHRQGKQHYLTEQTVLTPWKRFSVAWTTWVWRW
ncbi:MAG: hypothetical protein HC848_01020 [Limnobacter sp.]|nr:hypothetical protein [Limnobacter sp.]